ncbi:hypothetical protein ABT404_10825 [Streptomyces hyaluromycini]|uniref:Uncharacterized protein n=1 Tax=Streptomyces hyaluromycini TaxID=1377993 RepID=A0ABV1WSW8_9ACTN
MTERMKPPARRTSGRTLGGTKKTTPPPPPPTAELTHEQFAAEEAAAQGEGQPAPSEPQVQPAPSAGPVEASAWGRTEEVTEVAEPSAQPTAQARPGAGVEPVERHVPPVVPTAGPAMAAVQPTQTAEPAAQHGPSPVTPVASGAAPATEVAVRPAIPPMAGGTAFPVRTDRPGSHQEQNTRRQEAPSEGTPHAHGPGRPKDIPEAAVVLNQRIITRENLDSSVPAALKLKRRIKRFALDNELDHLPLGDIVAVAMDEWLTTRGF